MNHIQHIPANEITPNHNTIFIDARTNEEQNAGGLSEEIREQFLRVYAVDAEEGMIPFFQGGNMGIDESEPCGNEEEDMLGVAQEIIDVIENAKEEIRVIVSCRTGRRTQQLETVLKRALEQDSDNSKPIREQLLQFLRGNEFLLFFVEGGLQGIRKQYPDWIRGEI